MASPAHRIHYSYDEYLTLESSSNVKHEYLEGQIYAMAGGTPEHAAIAAATIGLLFGSLRGGRCRAYDSDLRIRVSATGLATYPDITIVCGPREHDPSDPNAVVNPTLLVEVLSRSTEEYDRGDKFDHYKTLPTLRQYVLVSPREQSVEVHTREADGTWTCERTPRGGVARFESIGATLSVDELFDAATEPSA